MKLFSGKFTSIIVIMLLILLYYMVFIPWISPMLPGGKPIVSTSPGDSPKTSPVFTDVTPSPGTLQTPVPSLSPVATNTPIVATPTPTEEPVIPEDVGSSAMKTGLLDCEFSTLGGGMVSCHLPFPDQDMADKGFMEYGSPKDNQAPMAIIAELKKNHSSFRLLFNKSDDPRDLKEIVEDFTNYEMAEDKNNHVVRFTGKWEDFQIVKTFTISKESYEVKLDVQVTNLSTETKQFKYLLIGAAGVVPDGLEKKRNTLVLNIGNLERAQGYHIVKDYKPREFPEDGSMLWLGPEENTTIDWIGTSSHFFAAFVNPDENVKVEGTFSRLLVPDVELAEALPTFEPDMTNIEAGIVLSPVTLEAGKSFTHSFGILLAPKFADVLDKYSQFEYGKIIDFGFFSFVAQIILGLLNLIYLVIPNYGVAIILLTIIIQILLHPLTRKQYVSMHKMQKLQPLIAEAQKRFKKDKKKLGEVTMAIYQRTGVNPFGTCLPMLIQLPVFFALYSAFYNCIELREASFLWIGDLSGQERIPLGTTLNLFFTQIDTINILPILMTAVWFAQQSVTPKSTDPNQQTTQKMMKFMPIIFFFLFYTFPSGLVLYWLVRNMVYISETLLVKAQLKKKDETGEFDYSNKVKLDTILKEISSKAKKAKG